MPRYFFDIEDGGECARDDEGLELPDRQAVKIEAARSLAFSRMPKRSKIAAWQSRYMTNTGMTNTGVLQAKFTFELDCPSKFTRSIGARQMHSPS